MNDVMKEIEMLKLKSKFMYISADMATAIQEDRYEDSIRELNKLSKIANRLQSIKNIPKQSPPSHST